jgi:hypothetical protein
MNVATTLVRRGYEARAEFANSNGDLVSKNVPVWGLVMLGTTALLFFGVMSMIEYTFGRLIPTLLVIESPQEAIVFEPLSQSDPDSTLKTPELQTIKPQPITASFRRSIKHLQAIGGFRARFRGFSVFLANAVIIQWIAGIITIFPIIHLIPRPLVNVLVVVACTPLSLAWTHIVISEPSPKPWFRRIPSMKMCKKVVGPTAVLALAEQVTVFVPFYIGLISGMDKTLEEMKNLTPHAARMLVLEILGLGALGLALSLVIIIPASVVLTRVQASLLPDSEETIVPFDRSFGGKVEPAIVGGSGVIGMLDAWKTFDWSARVRLVKAYVKVFAMQFATSFLFDIVFLLQLLIIVGKEFSKLIPEDGIGSGNQDMFKR